MLLYKLALWMSYNTLSCLFCSLEELSADLVSECLYSRVWALIMSSCGKYELFLCCRDDDASHSHSSMRGLHQHLLDLNHQSYWEKCRGTRSSFYAAAVVLLVVTTQLTKVKVFSDVQVSTEHDRFALFFPVKSEMVVVHWTNCTIRSVKVHGRS